MEDFNLRLYEDLFADMRTGMLAPYPKYSSYLLQLLFGKVPSTKEMCDDDSPIGRFLKAGLTLTIEDLYRNGFLPEGNRALEEAIFNGCFEVPQCLMEELGECSSNRTDVYFLGVPAAGTSCIFAGLAKYFYDYGIDCQPNYNNRGVDYCYQYYRSCVNGINSYKVPQSTGTDTISFMQLDLGTKQDSKVTIVEHSSEAFRALSRAYMDGPKVWERFDLGRYLNNNNTKMLFFLLDYSCIIGKNPRFSAADQAELLSDALLVFSNNGSGKHNEKDCTMSKVKTMAIIVTKSDLMDIEAGRPLSQEERADIAMGHLKKSYANFMNNLSDLCRKFGINANHKGHACEPIVITFSLGRFYIGNTVVFDETDTKRLAEFIMTYTPKSRRWGLFGS